MLLLPVTGTLPGLTAVQDINASFAQMVTLLASGTGPTTTTTGLATMANSFWYDTSTGHLNVRNATDTGWITLGTISQSGSGSFSVSGIGLPNYLNATDFASGVAPTSGSTGFASTANMFWYDLSTGHFNVRNSADSAWITLGTISQSGSGSFTVSGTGPNYLTGTLFASGIAPSSAALGFPSTANLFWHDTASGFFNVRNAADSAWIALGLINASGFIPSNSLALATQFASGVAPTTGSTGLTSTANVFWHDTTLGNWNVRNAADSAWIALGLINASGFVPSNTKQIATQFASSGVAPTSANVGFSGLTGLIWYDTSTNNLNIRNNADSAFIALGQVNQASGLFIPNSPGVTIPVGIAPVFPTIAALRAYTLAPSASGVSYVQGYTALNDGGQGIFIYRASDTTSPDNSGTIIVQASGGYRWYRDTQAGPWNVKWFGAKGDSSTLDATAGNNAVSGLIAAGGGQLHWPAGFYVLDAPIQVKPSFQPITFTGDGRYASQLAPFSGISAILVDTAEPSAFLSMGINYNIAASGTIGLSLDCTSGVSNAQTLVRDFIFQNCATGLKQFNAQQLTVDACQFIQCGVNSIYIQDTGNVNQGSNLIADSIFTSSGGTAAHIFYRSGDNLTVMGCQLIGANYGFQMSLASGNVLVKDLTISTNNFQAQLIAGCTFSRLDASGFFENIQVTDNIFGEFVSGAVAGIQVPVDAFNNTWILNFIANNNVFNGPAASSGFVGVMMSSVVSFQIMGGSMYAQGGATTRPYIVDALAFSGTIGPLAAYGTGIASGINNSTSSYVNRQQKNGTLNVTLGSGAVGGLYSGSGLVTFGPSYLTIPTVLPNIRSGSGAVSVIATSISATGCVVNAFGTTPSALLGVDWQAFG